ncbi:VOC family protein [Nocardioides alcanivorans]|uniref:VOC family protein n=1 Tax=Nocardioides alcanivorans TaxID=2897352 RepID=UPI001F36EF1A|nr:VOC family protein [Nocardioides alcanivorans]
MKIGHVIVPVADVESAARFYVERLGLELRFRDGDRYAAVGDGSVTLGLAAPVEQPVEDRIVVSLQVESLEAFLAAWSADDGDVGEIVEGGHERRVTLRDPFGNPVVVHERIG